MKHQYYLHLLVVYLNLFPGATLSKMKWENDDFHKSLSLCIYVGGFQPISKANILGFSFFLFWQTAHEISGWLVLYFVRKKSRWSCTLAILEPIRECQRHLCLGWNGMNWRMATTRHSFVMHYILLPHLSFISLPPSLSSPLGLIPFISMV